MQAESKRGSCRLSRKSHHRRALQIIVLSPPPELFPKRFPQGCRTKSIHMRLSIFSRLISGYLALFILMAAIGLYTVLQIRRVDAITRDIMEVDNLILDSEKQLADSLFSQIRYERKYIITKDPALYRHFLAAGSDYSACLGRIISAADSPVKKAFLLGAEGHYRKYRTLFEEEAKYIQDNKHYSQDWFRGEKAKAVEAVMEDLKELRLQCRQDTYSKVKKLRQAGTDARKFMAVLGGAALFIGVAMPLFITKSITRPIFLMVGRTREIANGIFKSDLNISSPPEIGELAGAFNSMCGKLSRLDKMKSDFFSSMSHELRTPLASIKEGTNLLLDDLGEETTEKRRKLLTIISEESDRLIGLVNSLMDLSKMEAGMMDFHFAESDITRLLDKAVAETELLSGAKGIVLEREYERDLPGIRMDEERMLQALRNLIGNAVKFTPGMGTVTVSAAEVEGAVKISVSDTGPGIPTGDLSLIFEKFQQSSLTDVPYRTKGTGLGLAIVKHVITAHGGKVWAESGPGKGSSFFIVLPL